MSTAIRLVVGLGNPGEKYHYTRHNIGYLVLDALEQRSFKDLTLFRPTHYMNESGLSVSPVLRKKGFSPNQLLVVLDDFSIPFGQMRIRANGSAGGHNGLKSLIEVCGTNEIPRLRLGIGPVPGVQDPADFVLGTWSSSERKRMPEFLTRACEAIEGIAQNGLTWAMNRFNGQRLNDGEGASS